MRIIVSVILLCFIHNTLPGQVRLQDDAAVKISSQLYYFIDSTGMMTDQMVRANSDLFSASPAEGLRITDLSGKLWLRLDIQNPYDQREESILIFDDPSLYKITLYESGEPPSLSGSSTDQEERDVRGNHNAFSITTEALGIESLYVQIESNNFITATATLYDDMKYHELARREYTFLGMFYGVMMLVILFSFLLFGLTKSNLFLLYSAYILISMLFTGMLDGFTPMYLNPVVEFSRGYLEYILAGLANALALFFTSAFLQTKQWSLSLDRILKGSAWLVIVITALLLIFIPNDGFEIMRPIGIVVILIIIGAGLVAFRKGIEQSSIFLISFVVYGIFILIFIFNLFRIIPFGFLSQYALHFGIMSTLLILSVALAIRIYDRYKTSYKEIETKKDLYSMKNLELEQLVWDRTKALILKENELRSIIDNSDNLIWMVDTSYNVREMNKGFSNSWMSAYGKKLIKGKNILDQIPGDELTARWKKRFDTVFKGRKTNFTDVYEIGGTEHHYEINAFPVKEGDKVIAAALYSREITERIRYEKQLRDNNTALQKANEELDSFVYSASHDLKAPLASIQGLIGLARDEKSNAQRKNYYDMMERSIRRLDQFIRDIIDYSRNTRMDNKPIPLDIPELVESILEDLKYVSPSDATEIRTSGETDEPLVSDETRLRIILRNLISNAIRYGKPDNRMPVVEVKWSVDREKAIFKVCDNGPGIEPEHIPHIFDMFYRANETASGSGLGVYIVKESLNKMGGCIDVSSKKDEGTEFTVTIPNNPVNK